MKTNKTIPAAKIKSVYRAKSVKSLNSQQPTDTDPTSGIPTTTTHL